MNFLCTETNCLASLLKNCFCFCLPKTNLFSDLPTNYFLDTHFSGEFRFCMPVWRLLGNSPKCSNSPLTFSSFESTTSTLAEYTWLKTVMCINHEWKLKIQSSSNKQNSFTSHAPLRTSQTRDYLHPKNMSFSIHPPFTQFIN